MRKPIVHRSKHRWLVLLCAFCMNSLIAGGVYAKPAPTQFKNDDQAKLLSHMKRHFPCNTATPSCKSKQNQYRAALPMQKKDKSQRSGN